MVPEDDFDDLTLLADLDESRGIEKEIEQADAALQDERGGSGHAFRRRPSAESAASSSAEYSSGLADRQLLSIGSKPFAVMSVNEHNKAVLRLSAKRGQFTGRLQAAPRRNFFPKHKGLRAMWWALVVVLPWLAAMALFVSFQVLTVVVAVGLLLVTLPVAWNRVQGRSAGAQLLFCSYVSGLLVVVVLFAVFLAKPTFNMYDDLDFAMLGDVTASSIKMSVRGGSGGALAFVVDFGLAESPRLTWNATTPQPLETGAGDAIGVTTVSGLEAGELYEYQIIFVDGNGDLANGPSGSFRTLPALGATGAAGAVSFASVSCQKKNSQVGGVELDGYSRIAALEPDALLFLGDFIYADVPWGFGGTPIGYGSKEALYESDYRNTIQDEHVKSFYANFPAYFMLDDHEILNNYSEGNDTDTFVAALNVWNRYLGQLNPKTPAVSAGGGEQYTFALGERADFFVFDTRFHRDLDAGIIAGTAQVAAVLGWLADTQAARQSFKFLVSSGGWSRNEPDTNDGWNCECPLCEPLTSANAASCLQERQVILDFIADNNITNVVLISGDAHKPGVFEVAPNVVEVSASPLFALGPSAWGNTDDPVLFEEGGFSTAFALYQVDESGLVVEIYGGGMSTNQAALYVTVCLLNALFFGALLCLTGLAASNRTPVEKFAAPLDKPLVALAVGLALLAALTVLLLKFNASVSDEEFEEALFTLEIPLV